MPAATPLPGGPSVLTLYSAADLLTAPGCPVCRYASQAGDRYFAWFALEGHAQPQMIATLGGSLGMCAAHSRRLMGQPGAAVRLTAVYRYVIVAARDRLASGSVRPAACPACEHHEAASGRALETLLDGLDDESAAERCRDLGGLCIPHVAAAGRGRRRVVAWLGEALNDSLAAGKPHGVGWLAGADHDAEARAVLRESIPPVGVPGPEVCVACLAAARAERDSLSRHSPGIGAGLPGSAQNPALCAAHLADAAAAAAKAGCLLGLLAEQAAAAAAQIRPTTGRLRWRLAGPHGGGSPRCAPCLARAQAAHQALADVSRALPESPRGACRTQQLCARHHLAQLAAGNRAAVAAVAEVTAAADLLARELAEEFEQTTWARRQGAPMPELSAWRRAAAFLDGSVFGGSPPR